MTILPTVMASSASSSLTPSTTAPATTATTLEQDERVLLLNTASMNQKNFNIYKSLGVPSPSKITAFGLNRSSWKLHGKILPFLHRRRNTSRRRTRGNEGVSSSSSSATPGNIDDEMDGDVAAPVDVFVNLRVLWCKAISSFDYRSPAYEYHCSRNGTTNNSTGSVKKRQSIYTTYNLLLSSIISDRGDSSSRWSDTNMFGLFGCWAVKYFWWCFPRWMHANIELRTAFLQRSIQQEAEKIKMLATTPSSATRMSDEETREEARKKVCLVVIGGGYDPRSVRWLDEGLVDKVFDLDLPNVVKSKRQLLLRCSRWFSTKNNNNNENDRPGLQLLANPVTVLHSINTNNSTSGDSTICVLHDNLCLIGVDLNDDDAFDNAMTYINSQLYQHDDDNSNFSQKNEIRKLGFASKSEQKQDWHLIFLSEAVLLYLEPGKQQRIFQRLGSQASTLPSSPSTFLFVDRLKDATTINTMESVRRNRQHHKEKNDGGEHNDDEKDDEILSRITNWLSSNGDWILDEDEFMTKRGATQHMGVARHLGRSLS
jgi:hypothetical protein